MFTTTQIGEDVVSFGVDTDNNNNVLFCVNDRFDYEESSKNRIAITKWLLSQFELAKKQYSYLTCSAYTGDGKGDYREKVYKKVGFQYDGHHIVWHKQKEVAPTFTLNTKE